MDLKDVCLDKYFKNTKTIDDFYEIYINCYNGLKSDIDRIKYTSHLGSLNQSYKDQKIDTGKLVKIIQEKLNQQIYDWAKVEQSPINLNIQRLQPPRRIFYDDTDATNTPRVTTDYLVVFIHHFVDSMKFGLDGLSAKLETINDVFDEIKEKIGADAKKYPDFSILQEIISQSIDYVALHDHCNTILDIQKEIATECYPLQINIPRIISDRKQRGKNQIKIDQIISDIAKSTSSKGTSSYEEGTIGIYLQSYLERPNLTRKDRLEVCLTKTENEKIKSEFINQCGDGILGTWERKLDETIEDYKNVLSL